MIVKVKPDFAVNSASAVRDALIGGLGIGFCPEFAVAKDVKAGRLVTLFDDQVPTTHGVFLVYPHRNHLSAKVRAFLDFAIAWYSPVAPWDKG